MRELVADRTVDAAVLGRDQILADLGQAALPFPDRIQTALSDRVFEASRTTMARVTGNVTGVLEAASREGLGIRDAATRLKTEFKDMRRFEMRRIARTELNRAQQDAAMSTMEEFGVTFHQWVTGGDERVRGSHRDQHNEVARVGEPFSNGLRRPLESGAPLREIVNCRCRIAPWIMPEGFMAPVGKRMVLKSFFPDEIVSTIESATDWNDPDERQEWLESHQDDFTDKEKDAIFDYSENGYIDINNSLRSGKVRRETQAQIDILEGLVAKNKLPFELNVNRGIGRTKEGLTEAFGVENLKDLSSLKGKVLFDRGFMSTTLKSEAKGGFGGLDVIMRMKVPAGTNTSFISPATQAGIAQAEVLLGRNTKFVVTEVRQIAERSIAHRQGQWEILVEVIP